VTVLLDRRGSFARKRQALVRIATIHSIHEIPHAMLLRVYTLNAAKNDYSFGRPIVIDIKKYFSVFRIVSHEPRLAVSTNREVSKINEIRVRSAIRKQPSASALSFIRCAKMQHARGLRCTQRSFEGEGLSLAGQRGTERTLPHGGVAPPSPPLPPATPHSFVEADLRQRIDLSAARSRPALIADFRKTTRNDNPG